MKYLVIIPVSIFAGMALQSMALIANDQVYDMVLRKRTAYKLSKITQYNTAPRSTWKLDLSNIYMNN